MDAQYTATQNIYGWSVVGLSNERWWPSDEAQEEIQASDDPAQAALEMAMTQPMRGTWHD